MFNHYITLPESRLVYVNWHVTWMEFY